ncbi:MAG: glycoside hydrolase family 44 protein [Kofleriaceae bacterium]
MRIIWGMIVLSVTAAHADVTVTVDATANPHPISPLIYGMNFPDDAQLAAGVPIARWGGNSTSRYNYELDIQNTANDYFFENIPGCFSAAQNYCATPPADPKEASQSNAFITAAQAKGATQLVTVPTLGYVSKGPITTGHPFSCGCPKTFNANQDMFDQYDTNCGNCQKNGAYITVPNPPLTAMTVTTQWNTDWVTYLTNKFGASNGKRIYALDNEPNLWSSTQHDVHPTKLTYDELWQRMRDNAIAILAADPTAEISGPAEWGWPNYFCSDADNISQGCFTTSPDRAAHGGEELVAWLLDQAKAYEQANGKRILHYFDLHYYPQGGNPPEVLRSLWDPTYKDPSYINDYIRLIPRMHDWVDQHYPGTKLLISEYDFYHHDEPVGAVTYAEALGIFGREGLDAATAWSPPAETEKAFGAYLLYLNYDGQGSHFESTSVGTTITGTGVQAFAATGNTKMTVVLVNETSTDAPVTVQLQNFGAATSASVYTGASPTITKQGDVAVAGDHVAVTVPAMSFAMVEIPRDMPIDDDTPVGGDDDGSGNGSKSGGCCETGNSSSNAWLVLGVGALLLRRQRRSR